MACVDAVYNGKSVLQYVNPDTSDIEEQNSTEETGNIFDNTAATGIQSEHKTSIFSNLEYDPEIGDYMPKKSIFSKIGDFFSGIGNAIKSFFEKLFGGKKAEETDNNTKGTNETNETDSAEDADNTNGTDGADNTDNAAETNVPDENDWGYFEGGNLPDRSELDFNVPDDVKQELIDKFDLSFYDGYDCVEFFYDTDGELVVLMPTGFNKDVDYYKQFGEVRYKCHNSRSISDAVGIAVNVEPTWETSDENLGTRDGAIGDTKQGKIGDCWLLSGVNALSYTDEGKQIIKDALEYHDGYTTVHLKGAIDYDITDEEVEKARCRELSTGDDDMIILELAIEKAYKDAADKNILLDSIRYDEKISKDGDSLDGSVTANLVYLITGKESSIRTLAAATAFSRDWNEDFLGGLETFEENDNKDVIMTLGATEEATIQDINGDTVKIDAPHGYAVKDVDENNLTFTNPHDSSIEITIPKDTASSAFSYYQTCDLENARQYKGAKESITGENGHKIFVYDEPDSTYDFYENKVIDYARRDLHYSKDGIELGSIYYDKDGNEVYRDTWYRDNP